MKVALDRFRHVLWSSDSAKLDLVKDRAYVIHQVLMYGTLGDIKDLSGLYSEGEIREVFLDAPLKVYTKPALRFVKDFLLKLGKVAIDEQRYLKSTPRFA